MNCSDLRRIVFHISLRSYIALLPISKPRRDGRHGFPWRKANHEPRFGNQVTTSASSVRDTKPHQAEITAEGYHFKEK